MKTVAKWLTAVCSLGVMLWGCSKNNAGHSDSGTGAPSGNSQVSLYIMDGPVNYYKVLIDIRQVAIKIDTSRQQAASDLPGQWGDNWRNTIWDTLSITPGVYDLLQLRNGVDSLLGTSVYPSGKILAVRLTLGSSDTVYTDSVTSYPLAVFGPNPAFTVNVRRENVYSVSNNDFKLWMDFNLQRSLSFWNGGFLLKPYITIFNDQTSGKLAGWVLPRGASPLVEAYNGTDTVYAVPNRDGSYLVRGMDPGTYSLAVTGHGGYQDTTLSNIVVNGDATTKAPTVTLHK